jgi:NAD(P)-dependent dehydrogenase (short-subunit alcohol dehydrogenase family)
MFDLTGRTALITGAGQGVGEGIARALATQGARVVVNDLVDERAETIASSIRDDGGLADACAFDVTDLMAIRSAVQSVEDDTGPIDVLINNAGNGGAESMQVAPFRELDPSAWEGPIRVNLYGVMNCCKVVIDGMCDRGWGRIITISSGAGTAGVAIGVSPYSAGKGGGIAFTRTLALEVASTGVTANTLAIGLMGLPDPEITAGLARSIPLRRTGTPDDVAGACVWLASDEAAWVTGQTIQLNGGSITT